MVENNIQKKIHDLEEQIRTSYNNTSILDDVCKLEPVSTDYYHGKFKQFANKFAIERNHITDSSHILSMGELGTSVARSEIKVLLRKFSEQIVPTKLDLFSIDEIENSIQELSTQDYEPTTIFIPSSYFHEILDWNNGKKSQFNMSMNTMHKLVIDPNTILNVKYSSKYVQFSNIIIVSKEANRWQYRPDQNNEHRLTVKFDWEVDDPINTMLLVKTIFNFEICSPNANIIFNLPSQENKV